MSIITRAPARGCAGTPCQSFSPGHNTHPIHARRLGESPWGWRDAFVTAIDDHIIRCSYVFAEVEIGIWHHHDLSERVRLGEPARLHEELHALGWARGWCNIVVVAGGLGPVPVPADPNVWRAEMAVGISDMSTGDALAVDHYDAPDQPR